MTLSRSKKVYCMVRISQVILQGSLPQNPIPLTFIIDWKKGSIKNWPQECDTSTNWTFKDVILTYLDKKGRTYLQVRPEEFRFRYNIDSCGVIKNWKIRKKDFSAIVRWFERAA